MKIDVLENAPLSVLGESPVWSKATQSLIYIDILGKAVHNFNPKTGDSQTMTFDQHVGFAAITSESTKDNLILLVGLENKIIEVSMSYQQITRTLLTVPDKFYSKGMRFNDGKCSPDGVLYTGLMHTKWRDGYRGYCLQLLQGVPSKPLSEDHLGLPIFVLKNALVKDGIHLPNGAAWHGSNTMYIVDSAMGEIQKLEFKQLDPADPTSKKLVDRNAVYTLPQQSIDFGYMLDGMTVDNKGKLWVALSGAGAVLRIDPATGQEIFRLHLEVKKPTSCTFGGQEMTDLFITTRNENADDAEPTSNVIVARMDGVRGIAPAVPVDMLLETNIEESGGGEFNCMAIFCGV